MYLYRVNVPFDETEESLRTAAEAGNFLKECMLAQHLYDASDDEGAFKHYTSAAKGGSCVALYNAAAMTELGLGTQKSLQDAVVMYRRAVSIGNVAEAMYRLGYNLVFAGCGEVEEGATLIFRAAKAGLVEAMYDWGMMHLFDVGLEEGRASPDDGRKWLKRALEGCKLNERKVRLATEAAFQLSLYHYTATNYKPITNAGKVAYQSAFGRHMVDAFQYVEYAAELGHALAQDFLGQLLTKGIGTIKEGGDGTANLTEARKWFRAASAQGVVSSKRDLALLIEGKVGDDGGDECKSEGPAEALRLYQEASDGGDIVAKFRLGLCYGRGIDGVIEPDTGRAQTLLLEAARTNFVPAIAHVLSTKMATDEDDVREFKVRLAKTAANRDHPARQEALEALSSLGIISSCSGCGVTKFDDAVKLSKCGKCNVAHYCSRECQTADWKEHRVECKMITDLVEGQGAEATTDEGGKTELKKTPS